MNLAFPRRTGDWAEVSRTGSRIVPIRTLLLLPARSVMKRWLRLHSILETNITCHSKTERALEAHGAFLLIMLLSCFSGDCHRV